MIVERSIAAGDGFQAVVKIENNFRQGQLIGEHDAGSAYVFEALLAAAFFFHQLENTAYVFLVGEDGGHDDRFFGLGNLTDARPTRGIINFDYLAICLGNAKADTGSRGDKVQSKFALQALLNDFHMQQTEEAAAKAEAEGDR